MRGAWSSVFSGFAATCRVVGVSQGADIHTGTRSFPTRTPPVVIPPTCDKTSRPRQNYEPRAGNVIPRIFVDISPPLLLPDDIVFPLRRVELLTSLRSLYTGGIGTRSHFKTPKSEHVCVHSTLLNSVAALVLWRGPNVGASALHRSHLVPLFFLLRAREGATRRTRGNRRRSGHAVVRK